MKKKITIFAILLASIFIGMPTDGFGVADTRTNTSMTSGLLGPQINVRIGQPRRRRGGYWRNGRWYRGQYRRDIARRYRLVPRYYWEDGRRRVRYVRVYYN
jgi:hypothetical protein